MRQAFPVVVVIVFAGFAAGFARQDNPQQSAEKAKATDKYEIPADALARVNPVKSSPEGLAEARKVFGYDCSMCHGDKGDGKGDVVESMKLEMRDWREPATLAGKTDGEIFYIITKGKGKMMAEGERVPEKLRWNLVNLVRAMAAKGGAEQKSSATTPAP